MSSATNAVADGSAELPVDHVVVIWCEVAEICIMELFRSSKFALVILVAFAPFKAASACDELVGTIITKHLGPAIEQADCPIPGMDKPGHKLVGVCYESAGPTSKIKIDTALNCHASGESVTSKLTGGDKALSKTENVSVRQRREGRIASCSTWKSNHPASSLSLRLHGSMQMGKPGKRWSKVSLRSAKNSCG